MAAGRGGSCTGPRRDDPAHSGHGTRRRRASVEKLLKLRESPATAPSSAPASSEPSSAAPRPSSLRHVDGSGLARLRCVPSAGTKPSVRRFSATSPASQKRPRGAVRREVTASRRWIAAFAGRALAPAKAWRPKLASSFGATSQPSSPDRRPSAGRRTQKDWRCCFAWATCSSHATGLRRRSGPVRGRRARKSRGRRRAARTRTGPLGDGGKPLAVGAHGRPDVAGGADGHGAHRLVRHRPPRRGIAGGRHRLATGTALFRHCWVVFSLALTTMATGGVAHPHARASAMADVARRGRRGPAVEGDLAHPAIGL